MHELPNMVDLFAVAEALERQGSETKFVAAVKNASRAQSCIADVRLSQTTLEAMEQLRLLGEWALADHKLAAEHALLANSIFLYARATSTGAAKGERGHTSVRDRLNSSLQRSHDWVVAVRNTALAHVRPNEALAEDVWHREIVFAKERLDGSWLPASMTRRIQSNPSLEASLRALISPTFLPNRSRGTVVILSAMAKDGSRRPFVSDGSMVAREWRVPASYVVIRQIVTEEVSENSSACTISTGRGLPT